jgi:hypothetical protein
MAILLATVSLAFAQAPTRVRGVIEKVNNDVLTIKAPGAGPVAVKLADNHMILAVAPAALADIKPGVYLSAASLAESGGRLKARGVLVYPDVARGINEGHYPYDLGPGSTVTYATVNTRVDGAEGATITLKYRGGQVEVAVPSGTPVMTFDLGDAALLKPGAPVFIPGQRQADGTIGASRVFVGKDGAVPPM